MRLLVTAGNTRESIDAVRDWGNIFTGNTGLAIAKALSELGEVDLLTSNRAHLSQAHTPGETIHPIYGSTFTSHSELKASLQTHLGKHAYQAIFMTAAVADYQPKRVYAITQRRPNEDGTEVWTVRDVQAGKVKSTHPAIAVLGEPTEKLVDLFRTAWGYQGMLVKFKLEVGIGVEELLKIGHNSRLASGADYLVANTLEMVTGANSGAYVLSGTEPQWVSREELPRYLVSLVIRSTKSTLDG